MENQRESLLPSASKAFLTQYGEKIGDYFFSPLRKFMFTEQGLKRWYAPRLSSRPEDGTGFAAINLEKTATIYHDVPIPAHRTILVAHAFETIAARVFIASPGTYFIAATFTSAVFEGEYVVTVCGNGIRLWEEKISNESSHPRYGVFLCLDSPGFVDFAINAEKQGQTVPCRTFVQYAVVKCDSETGNLQIRCDDRTSGLGEGDVIDLHLQTPFHPVNLAAPNMGVAERTALLEAEWTLPPEYIKSQFQRTPRELVELVLNNHRSAALKYCIFMIPRSGSTLLTEILANSGKLGFPGEFFVPDVMRTFSLAFSDIFSSYENFLTSGLHSENGVFGIEIEAERFQEEPDFFADVKNWRHIYIWREDILAQAISFQISIVTGVWHTFSGSPRDDTFPYIPREAVVERLNFLLGLEKFFLDFFRAHGISPYKISYEELVANPLGHSQKIAEHVGVEDFDLNIDEAKFMLQPTAKSRNLYYKALAISGGGEFWGYDICEAAGRHAAVLHGVDASLLDLTVERLPVVFIADNKDELCDKVQRHVTNHLAALPTVETKRVIESPEPSVAELSRQIAPAALEPTSLRKAVDVAPTSRSSTFGRLLRRQ